MTAGSTTFTVASIIGTWPTGVSNTYPFIVCLERGTVREEKILVGVRTGTSFATLTRGYDGTTAQSHGAGSAVEHVIGAIEMDESNVHVNTQFGVHGLGPSEQLVGTDKVQTLTNKTINSSNNTVTVAQASVTGLPAVVTASTNHIAASANVHGIGAGSSVVGTDTTQTLANKTLTAPTVNNPTIYSATIVGATINSGTLTGPIIVGGDIGSPTISNPTITDPSVSINGSPGSGAWSVSTLVDTFAATWANLSGTGTPIITTNWRHRFLNQKTVAFQVYVNISGGTLTATGAANETINLIIPTIWGTVASYATQFFSARNTNSAGIYTSVTAGGTTLAFTQLAANPLGTSNIANLRAWGTLELA
jgi:hypothetical protein